MNVARQKTEALERIEVPMEQLYVNDLNPNKMSDAEFNMLADNFDKVGFIDPLFVRRMPDGRYRIIGGAHRWEVAKMNDFETAPCTVITDPDFDDDAEKFQIVRMNVIRGKMTPEKFMKLYSSLSTKYTDEIVQEAFGFVEEAEFKKLVRAMSKTLPEALQETYIEAASEIKTIEGLSKLLNMMFTKYGDTLPYGYMVIDYGGKESVWLRMHNDTRKAIGVIGKMCLMENRSIDQILGGLIRQIADGQYSEQVLQLIAASKPIHAPEGFTQLPTENAMGVP